MIGSDLLILQVDIYHSLGQFDMCIYLKEGEKNHYTELPSFILCLIILSVYGNIYIIYTKYARYENLIFSTAYSSYYNLKKEKKKERKKRWIFAVGEGEHLASHLCFIYT